MPTSNASHAAHAPGRAPGRTLVLLLLGALASCRVVESHVWNLRQLHGGDGTHQYTAALEGDTEYFLREKVARSLLGNNASVASKTPGPVDDPATECLEQLIALDSYHAQDDYVAGLQIEWFSRLAVEDPWKLARERAVLGLGKVGRRIDAGLPAKLANDQVPAGAEALSTALAGLVQSTRPLLQGERSLDPTTRADLAAACELIHGMTLDLDGARRALRVANELADTAGSSRETTQPLLELGRDLQRRCVQQALAAAQVDRDARVRAAAVDASVLCAGPDALEPLLAALVREQSPEVVVATMQAVASVGLPRPKAQLAPAAARAASDSMAAIAATLAREPQREQWLAAIYDVILSRTESRARVSAMQALSSVTDSGLHSLREEDWQAWWRSQHAARVPAGNDAGGPGP